MGVLKCFSTLAGHSDRVWAVAWSPDGRLLASCGGDKTVRVWGVSGGNAAGPLSQEPWKCLAVLEDGPTRTIRSCCWSSCGRFLAAVSFDGTVVIWEKQRGSELQFKHAAALEGHDSEVKGVAWHPNGELLATCGRDKSVWIWEVVDGDYECAAVLHGHEADVKTVRWHPHENLLFSASYDDTIKVWAEDVDDWYCVETLQGHSSTVWALAFKPSGDRFASAGADGLVIIWRRNRPKAPAGTASNGTNGVGGAGSYGCSGPGAGEWRPVCRLAGYHQREVYSVDWSAAGHLATGGGDDCVRVFRESEVAAGNGSSSGPAGSGSSGPAGSGSSGGGGAAANEAVTFDLDATAVAAHGGDVNCVAWSPAGGGLLASAGDDELVKLWIYDGAGT